MAVAAVLLFITKIVTTARPNALRIWCPHRALVVVAALGSGASIIVKCQIFREVWKRDTRQVSEQLDTGCVDLVDIMVLLLYVGFGV